MSPSCRRAAAGRTAGRSGPSPTWSARSPTAASARPWSHQVQAAELAHAGRHVVVSTGTASGKSLAYQLPVLNALATDPRARVLYLSPTKALGHDQLRAAHALTSAIPRLRFRRRTHGLRRRQPRRGAPLRARALPLAVFQSRHDPPVDTAQPCPLGVSCCAVFDSWSSTNVITTVVFSARTWRWCCAGCCGCAHATPASPTVIFASATTDSPGATAAELIGAAGRGGRRRRLTPGGAHGGAVGARAARRPDRRERRPGAPVRGRRGGAGDGRPDRRGSADVDVRPVAARRRTDRAGRPGAAGRHRPGAVATRWRRIGPAISPRTAARWSAPWPRAGCAVWPPRTRWSWVSTSPDWTRWCLAGFPGTVASFWQQAGRSGRRGQGALVVLIARDDPLDTYLVHHPAALLDKPVERVVIDPANPYILGPQLLCAATELPLDDAEVRALGAEQVTAALVDDGLLRRRNGKYFPAPGVEPHGAVDIRGSIGRPDRHRGGGHRAAAGQRRRRPGPGLGASGGGLSAPGRELCRRLARFRRRGSRSCTPRIPVMRRSRENSPTSRSPVKASAWRSGP